MERQSKHVFVGGAVLTVFGLALVIAVWMVRADHGHQKQYDIFFESSTESLSAGSIVTFLGVPVGKIITIKLLPQAPQLVWVRISVDEHTPVLRGTTARIANVGITGVRTIDLSGTRKGASPIGDVGPFGMPVIPTRRDPLGFVPDLLSKAVVGAHRLGELLGSGNIHSIHHILGNVDRLTAGMAGPDPRFNTTVSSARAAFRRAKGAIRKLSTTRNILLDTQGRSVAGDLREATRSVRRSGENLEHEIAESRSTIQISARRIAPEISRLRRNLSKFADGLSQVGKSGGSNGFGVLAPRRDLPTYRSHRWQKRENIARGSR
jgi:phospholipid/cholesterol/gamma-HCH transport system substrate-binding protein